ncbi:phage head closure protein [Pseudomonas putida]|uniref:Head-tail adaptor protein n=1 Tax=Pseudomonas putida TaxID=303 RepID=A0A1X0ZM62_PSEPU|nr:phage head closure protein [Pseudomonas putida]ORL58110.1 head-tail adaptor protein [Pseudomonas putida]
MPISSGDLRHRVDIQRRQQVQDPMTGEIIETWVTLWHAVPAKIADASFRELIAAQAVQSKLSARVTIRYREGLDATMRIVGLCKCHQGRIFNPAGWSHDLDSGVEYLTASCSEGVNEG